MHSWWCKHLGLPVLHLPSWLSIAWGWGLRQAQSSNWVGVSRSTGQSFSNCVVVHEHAVWHFYLYTSNTSDEAFSSIILRTVDKTEEQEWCHNGTVIVNCWATKSDLQYVLLAMSYILIPQAELGFIAFMVRKIDICVDTWCEISSLWTGLQSLHIMKQCNSLLVEYMWRFPTEYALKWSLSMQK